MISTASSDRKLERLKQFGLDHGIKDARGTLVIESRQAFGRVVMTP